MKLLGISDALHNLLVQNDKVVKQRYLTYKLYADSAIREKLRRDGVAGVGDDDIVAHLKKLESNKKKREDKMALMAARRTQERRIRRAKERLDQ